MEPDVPQATTTARARPPAPSSVSEQAQRVLSQPDGQAAPYPPLDDTEAWLRLAEATDTGARRPYLESTLPPDGSLNVTQTEFGGVPTYELRPTSSSGSADEPLFIELHGGALWLGGGELAWMAAARHAIDRVGLTWAPDYRMPPLHPFPAALDDVLAVYRAALNTRAPSQIVVSGGSAGGNLAAALMLRAKEEGLPLPAALVLLTPEVDLTESGDTFRTNDGIDSVISSLMTVNLLYAGGQDLAHPHLSPLFGDLTGLPPTLLVSGTRDLFLSNTVRMHRALLAAGVAAELHVFEAMPHGNFGGATPEDAELQAQVRTFETIQLARAADRGPAADGGAPGADD